jgi:altronate dehydratase
VAASHKIALVDIKAGGDIIRYGEPIVQARDDIKQGQWVHVHNTQPIERI